MYFNIYVLHTNFMLYVNYIMSHFYEANLTPYYFILYNIVLYSMYTHTQAIQSSPAGEVGSRVIGLLLKSSMVSIVYEHMYIYIYIWTRNVYQIIFGLDRSYLYF